MLVFLPKPAGTTACMVGISRLSLSGVKVLDRPLNQSSSSLSLKKVIINSRLPFIETEKTEPNQTVEIGLAQTRGAI